MAAYNPPLSESDARTGPPPYENSAKSTLLVIAWICLVLGVIITIGTGVRAGDDAVDSTDFVAILVSLAIGLVLVMTGLSALVAFLATRSVTYDLLYRFGPHPDYVSAATTLPAGTDDDPIPVTDNFLR